VWKTAAKRRKAPEKQQHTPLWRKQACETPDEIYRRTESPEEKGQKKGKNNSWGNRPVKKHETHITRSKDEGSLDMNQKDP